MPKNPFILFNFFEGSRGLALQVCVLVNEIVAGDLANVRSMSKKRGVENTHPFRHEHCILE